MSYLEIKQRGQEKYAYFVKKWSLQGKKFVLRKYLGKATSMTTKEQYLRKNLDGIVKEELEQRKQIWKSAQSLVYDRNIIEDVERKAVLLNNLAEERKAQDVLRTEFAKEFIYNSNNIEGSKIPKEMLVEIFEKGTTNYKNKNEIAEVENSIKAFEFLEKEFSFTIKDIKRLYHILTKNMILETKEPYPKGFKTTQIVVGNAITTEPEKVQEELESLLHWNKENAKKIYPLKRAFDFHSRYEAIHPFRDGNGRTGRLILNKILMQNNYSPIIVYKQNKTGYFNAIKDSREGDKKNYYQFMLNQTRKTYDQMIATIKKS